MPSVEDILAAAIAERVAEQLEPLRTELAEIRRAIETPQPPMRLTRTELAATWGVSTRHIAALVARGMCEIRVGDAPRYVLEDCEAWCRSQDGST